MTIKKGISISNRAFEKIEQKMREKKLSFSETVESYALDGIEMENLKKGRDSQNNDMPLKHSTVRVSNFYDNDLRDNYNSNLAEV